MAGFARNRGRGIVSCKNYMPDVGLRRRPGCTFIHLSGPPLRGPIPAGEPEHRWTKLPQIRPVCPDSRLPGDTRPPALNGQDARAWKTEALDHPEHVTRTGRTVFNSTPGTLPGASERCGRISLSPRVPSPRDVPFARLEGCDCSKKYRQGFRIGTGGPSLSCGFMRDFQR